MESAVFLSILNDYYFLAYVLAGAVVGFAVGVTGVGGGSLMTPMLLMFGFPPATAIGTDLLYAAITKSNGIYHYHKQKVVNWNVTGVMLGGSLPASVLTIFILHQYFPDASAYQELLTTSLGFMLMLTALVLIFRNRILKHAMNVHLHPEQKGVQSHPYFWTLICGIFLGVLVTLSSIGAGAFGTAVLMMLYPRWISLRIVGTDLAHAVPLTLTAGIGHIFLGHVDWFLLFALLCGSLPAIYYGSKVASKLPDRMLQIILAVILGVLGAKYAFA